MEKLLLLFFLDKLYLKLIAEKLKREGIFFSIKQILNPNSLKNFACGI